MNRRRFISLATASLAGLGCGCTTETGRVVVSQRRQQTLKADGVWRLNPPKGERFDASGLLLMADGSLLTVNDRGAAVYRIEFSDNSGEADLKPIPGWFTKEQLAAFTPEKHGRYDIEGLTRDSQGRIYLCEEADRWVLRLDPKTGKVERLEIDWTPVRKYFSQDGNASWEGITVGEDDRLYLANERKRGRIVVVDLKMLKVVDNFAVGMGTVAARDVSYSDLSWQDGHLFVLLREYRCVLEVDPVTRSVVAEYDYRSVENNPADAYHKFYPTGIMEGLAVDGANIWLVTDNNGRGRLKAPDDHRPTLFRCPRNRARQ